jgi:hypothetical protein
MRVLLFFAISAVLMAAGYPEAEISNGLIRARLHLPSPGNGSYQGTRFDWSGIIYSLQYSGHEYFGQWYEKHDPKIHDAITGPVEEFRTNEAGLGYDEAPAGGTFVRIGAGVVRKPDEPAYQLFKTYEIVDPGKWSIRKGADWIEFTQRLKSPDGYAYEYRKTVRLLKGQPRMALEHMLRNTGKRAIETTQYNHNFFVIDGETVGPGVTVKFGFDARPARDLKGLATVRDRQLTYTRDLEKGQSLLTELEGFGQTASDYDFRIENRKSGAGVHISGDQPLAKLVFWCIRTVACPEPYIHLRVEPGQKKKWRIEYEFYTLK